MVFKNIMEAITVDSVQMTLRPDVTPIHAPPSVHILSSSKDSIHVKWAICENLIAKIQAYKVRYQALGSHVVQYSGRLPGFQRDYDIKQLHEDTSYKVCLEMYPNNTTPVSNEACIQATTKTDSFHVALASALGAFLALGIIVAFVFLAKWQHTRRQRKRLKKIGHNGDIYHSRDLGDVDYMSELSMQVNESQVKMSELDSQLDFDATVGAIACELSDCSEEPLSYHSNNYLAGSYNSSHFLTGSRERCCNCDDELCDSYSARSLRSKYSREKSVDSARSVVSRQYSTDSYGSKRNALHQHKSRDSSRRELLVQQSFDSGRLPISRQKSQDSDYSDHSPCSTARIPHSSGRKRRNHGNKHSSQSNSPGDIIRKTGEISPNAQLFSIPSEAPNETLPIATTQESSISQQKPLSNQDERPPDVRPKDRNSGTHFPRAFVTKQTLESENEEDNIPTPVNYGGHIHGIRPNASCPNW